MKSATNLLLAIIRTNDSTSDTVTSLGKVGVDYFTLYNQDYLLIIDYFSKYPEVIQVSSKTAAATIQAPKATFAHY